MLLNWGMKKARANITLDQEVLKKVDEKASKDDRARSYTINRILRKFFKLDKEKPTAKGS
jgi:metal-responsive CopG/Arc/MetJ family transcriptional regulator